MDEVDWIVADNSSLSIHALAHNHVHQTAGNISQIEAH